MAGTMNSSIPNPWSAHQRYVWTVSHLTLPSWWVYYLLFNSETHRAENYFILENWLGLPSSHLVCITLYLIVTDKTSQTLLAWPQCWLQCWHEWSCGWYIAYAGIRNTIYKIILNCRCPNPDLRTRVKSFEESACMWRRPACCLGPHLELSCSGLDLELAANRISDCRYLWRPTRP